MTSLSLQRQENVKFQKRQIAVESVPCHHGVLRHNKTHVEAAPCSEPAARRILPPSVPRAVASEGNDLSRLLTHTHSLHSELQIACLRCACWVLGTQRQEVGSKAPVGRGRRKYLLPTDKKMQLNTEPVCMETGAF